MMTVGLFVGSFEDQGMVVLRLSGHVMIPEVFEAVSRIFHGLEPDAPYRSLLVFDSGVDLSEFSIRSLDEILAATKNASVQRIPGSRRAAAVLHGSADARMVLPLWNAICSAGREGDFGYGIFDELEPALHSLDIPLDKGREFMARAT